MSQKSKIRLFGFAVLIFNIYLVGAHPFFSLTEKCLMLWGFAAGFEFFVVRLIGRSNVEHPSQNPTVRTTLVMGPVPMATGRTIPDTAIRKPTPTPTIEDEVAAFGIERVGDMFRYQTYKYDRLEDALKYARHDQARGRPVKRSGDRAS